MRSFITFTLLNQELYRGPIAPPPPPGIWQGPKSPGRIGLRYKT